MHAVTRSVDKMIPAPPVKYARGSYFSGHLEWVGLLREMHIRRAERMH
jgi:hypothetical protein